MSAAPKQSLSCPRRTGGRAGRRPRGLGETPHLEGAWKGLPPSSTLVTGGVLGSPRRGKPVASLLQRAPKPQTLYQSSLVLTHTGHRGCPGGLGRAAASVSKALRSSPTTSSHPCLADPPHCWLTHRCLLGQPMRLTDWTCVSGSPSAQPCTLSGKPCVPGAPRASHLMGPMHGGPHTNH